MDKQKAIETFLDSVEKLTRLPLITDAEMDGLFGEEVAALLAELNRSNREEKVCQNCENRCCQAISCEFYIPEFDQCPIYDFRPAVCRLHFCHRFEIADNSVMKDLADVFFDSLVAADRNGSNKVRLFDSPPLAICSPDLIAVTSPWLDKVREGTLNHKEAAKLIRQEAEKYRIKDTDS